MNHIFQYAAGLLFALCLVITLLFTSVEAAVYWTPGYFEREYAKYNVTEAISMSMEDLLEVTDQMMAYLRGNREDLHVETTIDGVRREFFNQREIAHMEDVRGLFLNAIALRKGCLGVMALTLFILVLLKTDFKRTFPKAICIGFGLFLAAGLLAALVISTDFTRYFILFHHMFFSNDLWILNPATDMLINIVPEGFFRDTVFLIGAFFLSSLLFVFFFCLFLLRKGAKKRK